VRWISIGVALLGVGLAFPSRAQLPVPIPLTDNETEDANPAIHDGRVVWQGEDGTGDTEIYLSDGGETPVPLTDDDLDQAHPAIHGERIAWDGWDGEDWEVYLLEGGSAEPVPLSDDQPGLLYDATDRRPAVSASWVIWNSPGSDVGPASPKETICRWDGLAKACLPQIFRTDDPPALSGSLYVYISDYSFPDASFVSDAAGIVPGWIAQGPYLPLDVDIDADTVTLSGPVELGGPSQIFLDTADGDPVPLTDDETDNRHPALSLPYVVWEHFDGADWEIHVYDGVASFPLTDNEWDDRDPDVSGDQVVWESYEGGDAEIVLAAIPAPEPGAALAAGAALVGLAATTQHRAVSLGRQ
jgi:hypothetical protein